MLFACCDPVLPAGSQLVLALKTLCGFDVREIEVRLFASEANVYKRLHRARIRLRALPGRLGDLPAEEYSRRLAGVQQVLYLLFTEGHLA
jgi:RNA polymerase sigma-70 factor (ECF subfamily)